MSEFTQNKTAGVFATVLIGIIILAFMFTGYQQFEHGGSVTNVGSVNGMPIKPEEYNNEYNRQVEFYKQIMGGEVSSKQLESFKIKDMVIKNIVQRKLLTRFAKDFGAFPAEEEVKAEIKTLPYFLTNGQFDIARYKAILSANRLTPLEFEQDVVDSVSTKKIQEIANTFPLSKAYLDELANFRKEKVSAEIVQISKGSLGQFITVSPEELNKFFAVETNLKRVESMFNERKESLSKPEEVTAKHILLLTKDKDEAKVKAEIEKIAKEVTPANFSKLADKYTEDPSGKGKGGDLGSFGRGRMVPEFEEAAFTQKIGTISAPIKTNYGYHLILVEKKTPATVAKLEDFKEKFAKEIVQKDKVEDLKKLTVDIANSLRKALESGNATEVKNIVAKYKLQYDNTTINKIDGVATGTFLSSENMKSMFSQDLTKPQFHSFDDGASLIMVRTTPPKAGELVAEDKVKEASADASLKSTLAKKMMENIMKELEANAKIKINENVIQM